VGNAYVTTRVRSFAPWRKKKVTVTVESLEIAKAVVGEMGADAAAAYEYRHAVTGKKLWSVETDHTRGTTEASGCVSTPRLIYTREQGWSA
jgi:hypothetical protein